jgi:hypothetical protein
MHLFYQKTSKNGFISGQNDSQTMAQQQRLRG